jgi:chemotaxis signal transduction protein
MLTTLDQLREEFDSSFARPHPEPVDDLEAFVTIQVGARPYALRVAELGGIHVDVPITRVPSRNPAAIGLCGIQGTGIAVFDLAQLLLEPKTSDSLRWMALSAGRDPIAFAFSQFEGYAQASARDLGETTDSQTNLTGKVLRLAQQHRPIIRIATVVAIIRDSENPTTGK